MDFSTICRTCIKTCNNFGLNPIFPSEDNHERLSSAFYSCTGVQVKFNDGLPQNMCNTCKSQFNSILKFRKQCKQVETQLMKIKTELESDNSIIFTHDQLFTQTEECSVLKIQLTTTNKSDFGNFSNVNKITSDFVIKNERLGIEEDQPLNCLVKSNMERKIYDDEMNTENISDTEFFNEDIISHRNNLTVENTVSQTNNSTKKSETYLQKTNASIQKPTEIKINRPETNRTQEKTIDIPYIITETVTKKTMRVVCKLCQKELSIRSIDSHMMRRHPGADERKVKCDLCDKYVMRQKLNRHRMMMHGSIGVRCGYCKSDFNSKEVLVDHVTTCTAKIKRRKANESGRALAECDICKMTMQRASLNKHKAVKHAGLRPVCEHCGKSFGNKFRLNEHYRAKHGYEKFQCSYCDFRSAGIMAMRNHERRHRGEKPYVCETCGAKFHAAYLLLQHKHSHNTEKLVKCDLCPASFKANNNLHMHKLTCHSKSFYSCTLCARPYKCRYYAIKHVRLAHRVSDASGVIKVLS